MLISLIAIVTVGFSSAVEVPTVSINPPVLEITDAWVGQIIQVNITVDNVENLWSWGILDFTFNSSVLEFTGMQEGDLLREGGETIFAWKRTPPVLEDDIQNIACARLDNSTVSGSGVLATAFFKVLSTGTTQLTMKNATLHNNIMFGGLFNTIDSVTVNGEVKVLSITASAPPTNISTVTSPPSQTPSNPASDPLPTVWVAIISIVIIAVFSVALLAFWYAVKVKPHSRSLRKRSLFR
jgi:hypothetical protein